ncbi:uncharacterized protein LOC118766316 [Octopus sinensis]|uniref:Uncharacterized protein LOC118766316 n=1 Tax=Octopus sinensis TaxID=2607531 RepID=A0A7E6FE18_9MOLL|nr:uncharacterized protein LOC118766316 [Octopus sinensis]
MQQFLHHGNASISIKSIIILSYLTIKDMKPERIRFNLFFILSILLCCAAMTTPENETLVKNNSITGQILVSCAIIILCLPFIGMICYLINIRCRFVIFDIFFPIKKDIVCLRIDEISPDPSLYHIEPRPRSNTNNSQKLYYELLNADSQYCNSPTSTDQSTISNISNGVLSENSQELSDQALLH